MSTTRTPGITIAADGRFFIDKRHRGIRIGVRVGATNQEQAEQRLRAEMQQVDADLARRASARPTFADCAARYLTQSQNMRSIEAIRIHVRLLAQHIGHLAPHQVHDATLAPFISARIAEGASATTINRSLEVARTILHRAARSYRDECGHSWLDAVPPLIAMLPECARPPYPGCNVRRAAEAVPRSRAVGSDRPQLAEICVTDVTTKPRRPRRQLRSSQSDQLSSINILPLVAQLTAALQARASTARPSHKSVNRRETAAVPSLTAHCRRETPALRARLHLHPARG